jgi:hypothetical protein
MNTLTKRTWPIVALALAGFVFAGGAANRYWMEKRNDSLRQRVDSLQKKCDAEQTKYAASHGPTHSGPPPTPEEQDQYRTKNGRLILPPIGIGTWPQSSCDAQDEIIWTVNTMAANAQRASNQWPTKAAALLAILSVLPWAWYFMLRRIAELRDARTGKPPTP